MKIIYKINILTYLYLLLALLSGLFKQTVIILSIMFIHELGHIILIYYFKYKIERIEIYPYGFIMKIKKPINIPIYQDMLISINGIVFQIILSIIINLTYKNSTYLAIFNMYNSFIMLLNILPIYPLDGYQIINHLLNYIFSYYHSQKISNIISFIISLILIIYMALSKNINILIGFFIISNSILVYKENYLNLIKFYYEQLNTSYYYRKIKFFKHNYLRKREYKYIKTR